MLLTDIEPLVRPFVGNCPQMLVVKHLRTTTREFCAQTHAWMMRFPALLSANNPTHYLVMPEGVAFVALTGFVSDVTGDPVVFATGANSALTLVSPPAAQQSFTVTCAVKPALSASELSDVVGEKWGDAIAFGAIGYTLSEPGRAWTNLDLAGHYKSLFVQGMGDAKTQIARNFMTSEQHVNMVPFA